MQLLGFSIPKCRSRRVGKTYIHTFANSRVPMLSPADDRLLLALHKANIFRTIK